MGLKVDGIATSEHVDSSGELLLIENHDITDLKEGKGVLNFEHSNKHEDIVGAVIYAHKILKKEDCENERQRKYWDFVKKPFVYIIGELFDDQDHPGAIAVAAMVRYYASKKEKMLIGFSIEGATLERDGNILKETVGRRVAMTLRPCNKTAIADLYEDAKSEEIKKSIEFMSKNVDETISSLQLDSGIFEQSEEIGPQDLFKHLEDLNKTLTAGMGNVAPSQLVGGAALTVEDIASKKNRIKAAIRDWNRKRPLKEVIKAALPEVSDDYIDNFVELAEDLALKKGLPKPKLIRIDKNHGHFSHDDDQHSLIDGLYLHQSHEPAKEFEVKHENFSNPVYDLQNDAGQRVLVKKPASQGEWGDEAHNSHSYYRMAKDYFGLGKHVPHTALFSHPELKEGNYSAIKYIPDAKTPIEMDNRQLEEHLNNHFKSGNLHKLMIMDHILGVADRHGGNILLDKSGGLYHIDNDLCLKHDVSSAPEHGFYHQDTAYADHPVHPEAMKWLNSLDAAKMAEHMLKLGIDKDKIKSSIKHLNKYKDYSKKGYNLRRIADLVSGDAMFGRKG